MADAGREQAVQMRAANQSIARIAKEIGVNKTTVDEWFCPYNRHAPADGRKDSPLRPIPKMVQARLAYVLANAPKQVGITMQSLLVSHMSIRDEAIAAGQLKAARDTNMDLIRLVGADPELGKVVDTVGTEVLPQDAGQLMAELGGVDDDEGGV